MDHEDLTKKIIGCAYNVYSTLGAGFLESVYRKALALALRDKGLIVAEEVPVSVFFRGKNVGDFKADLVINGVILLELKTAESIVGAHESQVINYLRATNLELGTGSEFWAQAPGAQTLARQHTQAQEI